MIKHILMQCLIPFLIVYELKGGTATLMYVNLLFLLTLPSFGTSSFSYDVLYACDVLGGCKEYSFEKMM